MVREGRRHPRPSPVCLAMAKAGDREALGHLYELNRGRIAQHAIRMARPGRATKEDLMQAGYMGLQRAARDFDPGRRRADGTPLEFITYADWWIFHDIQREAWGLASVVKPPFQSHQGRLTGKVKGTIRYPAQAAAALAPTAPIGVDDRKATGWSDPEEPGRGPEAEAEAIEEAGRVRRAVATLPVRHRELIEARFGLDGGMPRTLHQIGRDQGVHRERARMVEAEALAALRATLRGREIA